MQVARAELCLIPSMFALRAGIAHRDPRWQNIIKVVEGGKDCIKLIDIEVSGPLDGVCKGGPYPLPHWKYSDGRTVLEHDHRYSARSDLKMIGKELMARLSTQLLGAAGEDLRRRLEEGQYESAADVLAHEWFQ